MDLRTLAKAEFKADRDGEYYLGVDVARSQNTDNNQCSVAVVKVKRNDSGKITAMQLVNIINIPSILNFKVQAQEIMKIRERYRANVVVLDSNGLGIGLQDALILEQVDPNTGDSLGCWKTINTDDESELEDADEVLYSLKSQGINSEIIVNFMDMVDSKKLQLLEKRADNSYDKNSIEDTERDVIPYLETDFLLEEVANLKLKPLNSGKFTVEQQTNRINKDRYSALAYVLWYIQNFESDYGDSDSSVSVTDYLLIN